MRNPDHMPGTTLSVELRRKISELQDEGYEIFQRFDTEVRSREFHPFIPGNYARALEILLEMRSESEKPLKFLEWGSATGVIAIMADLVGFEAYGIEIDGSLVDIANTLAAKYGSKARFCQGSLVPAGHVWRGKDGDTRTATIEQGRSGYIELEMPLEEFDIVYVYPWDGESDFLRSVMESYGRPDARFILAKC
jgi:hypothetical protein